MSNNNDIHDPAPDGHRLNWTDGFAFSLIVPISFFFTMTYAQASIGSYAVALLYSIICVVALGQNKIYTELALMFPGRTGGIATFAHEGWKPYAPSLGALAALGYWLGWAGSVSVFALSFGQAVQTEFFSEVRWSFSFIFINIELSQLLGIGALVFLSLLNCLGLKHAARLNKVFGLIVLVLIAAALTLPILQGTSHLSNATWRLTTAALDWSGVHVAFAILFVFAWSGYSTEICAVFANEYKSPKKDTTKALRYAGVFTLVCAVVMPIGLGAIVGDQAISSNPASVFIDAFRQSVGAGSSFVTLIIAASMLLIMNSCIADAGQALYALAKEGITIKQIDKLSKKGIPVRGIIMVAALNLALMVCVGNVMGIILASNIGYILCVILTLCAFVLLRRDRPNLQRPLKLSRPWITIAIALAGFNSLVLLIGGLSPDISGYGGIKEQLIAVLVLALAMTLFFYRSLVQNPRISVFHHEKIEDEKPDNSNYTDDQSKKIC